MAADKRCQDLVLPFYFRLVALNGRGLGCLAPPGALFRCSPATQPQAMLKSEEWQFPKFRTNILINQTINCTISIFIIIFNIWFDRKEGLGGQVILKTDKIVQYLVKCAKTRNLGAHVAEMEPSSD